MIMGASLFDTVLERVGRERPLGSQPAAAPRMSLRSLGGLFAGGSSGNPAFDPIRNEADSGAQDYFNETYFAFLHDHDAPVPDPDAGPKAVEAKSAIEPEPEPSMYQRLSVEEIRADLNLERSDTPVEIRAKRRSFARLNHPDRAPEAWRTAATARMKTANRLADDALRAASLDGR
ncbi:MAG: hypothetical protein RIC18_16970 [Hoeflea sp.]|uniref:hypothetical protein n=1 Tax=Hoeflea sp. TaxID=1940281 RepID=UPI0032EFA8F7